MVGVGVQKAAIWTESPCFVDPFPRLTLVSHLSPEIFLFTMLRLASASFFITLLATLTAAQDAAKPTAAQPNAAQPTDATPAADAEPVGQDPPAGGNPKAKVLDSHNKPTKPWAQWQPKPTYAYEDLPDKYMGDARGKPTPEGFLWNQTGFNRCAQGDGMWNSQSLCQTAWINSLDDFGVDKGDIGGLLLQVQAKQY